MAGKSRQSANLTSKNNIFVDAVADNTGIGTTSPKSKLDVVGNARISGILTVGVSSSVTIDGNAGIVSATKLYAAGIDVASFIAGAGYASTAGIATVALGIVTTANINTSGIITASRFVGDGSLLNNISVGIRSAGTFVGTATTIDFGSSNIAITTSRSGIVTVGISSNVIVSEYQPTIFKNYDLWFSLLDVAGFTILGTSDISGTWQANGGATLSTNSATLLTNVGNQARSVVHSRQITSDQYYGMEITFRSIISGTADAIGFALWDYNSTNLSSVGGAANGAGINATSNMFGVYLNFYSSLIQIQGVNGTVNTSYSGSNIIGTHIWKITLSGSDYLSMNVSVYRNDILVASRTGVQMPLSSRFAFGGATGGLSASATVDQVLINYTASGTPNMYQAYVRNPVNNSWKSYNPTYATVSQISGISSGITTTANINTVGIITASRFVGSGSSLTGVVGLSTQWITTSAGIHTLSNVGIGTTNPTSRLTVTGNALVSGIVTASNFAGNLSGTATTSVTSGYASTAGIATYALYSEVSGISTTAITAENVTETININTSGIVTATKFVGDGSGLSGIVAAGSGGISLQNDSSPVGTAGTINFDNNFDLEISGGIATVTFLTAPGLTTTASVNTTGIITASSFVGNLTGTATTATTLTSNSSVNTTGIITASNFSGNFTGTFVGSGSSLTGVVGLSTQWITTSAGIHTLSKVGIGTTNPVSNLEVFGTVSVAGTSGQLFSVVDSLATGSIFSVNDISGIPSIDVDADGSIELAPFNGNVGIGTTRPRARLDVLGSVLVTNISVGIITATTFSGNIVTRVNGSVGIVSVGIVSMTDFLYQPQGVVTLSDRWDSANAINSSGGWDTSTLNSLPIVRLNWVPSASQNGTSGATWRTNFLDKVKAGDIVQWSKDGINWNSFIQPFDSINTGANSVGFYPGSSVTLSGSIYVRYIITRATGVQALQNGQILQYDSVYTKWMPFGPYADWESTSAGINTLRSVGIGTTNPTNTLHVRSSTNNGINVDVVSGYPAIWLSQNGTNKWSITSNLNNDNAFIIRESGVADRLNILTGGNVGIGTTNPTSRLTVSGDVLVSGVVTASSFIGTTFIGTTLVGNLTGTATTAVNLTSNTSVNTTGVITATKFVGDGSGLTGIVATSSGGIFLQNDGINIGAASTINFSSNFVVETSGGIGTVGFNTTSTITAAAFVGDGSGLTNITGGGGASSRTVVSGVTTALVVNGIGNTEISGFKTYGVLKVGVSSAAWVRLYTDSTSRSNDASRSIEVDPITGSGVIAEVATAGIATVKMTPFIVGFNDDNPVTNTIYVSVKNLTGITTSISVNLTILKMEE